MAEPVLAQFTIRAKQEYIYRSNRILEIVGASALISDAFELLLDETEKAGLRVQRIKASVPFSLQETQREFGAGRLQIVELFRGGGNATLLFDSAESYRQTNHAFTYAVLAQCPGMIPMGVCCPFTGDYRADYKVLMARTEEEKNRMIPGRVIDTLPFALMDRNTFQPMTTTCRKGNEIVWLTAETAAKQERGTQCADDDTRLLDALVTERGTESMLAVVHADGNNMGKKIIHLLGENHDYDFCVNAMRRFTEDTNAAFVNCGMDAVHKELDAIRAEQGVEPNAPDKRFCERRIVADGDDVTFICNARWAKRLTETYLKAVSTYRSTAMPDMRYSSCAGICLFHSHYPFVRAYMLAEQACDNAKKPVHASLKEEAWLDFHYVHSGVGGDLNELRARQGTEECMHRPWCAQGECEEKRQVRSLDKLAELFTKRKVSRSNIKGITAAWEDSREEGQIELERLYYHTPALQAEAEALFSPTNELLQALYDLAEVWDLWYT
jgi:hypothetical protein